MLVLVTRPRDQAAGTADLLRAAGHEVLVDPVLEIRRVPMHPPLFKVFIIHPPLGYPT